MSYKAVIFDLDGTLLDTIDDICDSCNAVLKRMGYQTFSVSEYKHFVGRGVDELIATLIDKGEMDPAEFHEIKTGYLEEYAVRQRHKTRVYDGMIEVLKQLKAKDIKIGILSNKPHFQTIDVVNHYLPMIAFDKVMGKRREYPIKPNPEALQDILKEWSLEKTSVLYIGDTNTDMQTAFNAGVKSVGVLWGFRSEEELLEAGAQIIVSKPREIIDIVFA